MSQKELIERNTQALRDFTKLPPEEQWRLMQEWGTIDKDGNVLLGTNELDEQD